jgi:hypothetical protein
MKSVVIEPSSARGFRRTKRLIARLETSGLHQASGTLPANMFQIATDWRLDLRVSNLTLQHQDFGETGHIHDAQLHPSLGSQSADP